MRILYLKQPIAIRDFNNMAKVHEMNKNCISSQIGIEVVLFSNGWLRAGRGCTIQIAQCGINDGGMLYNGL